MVLLRRMKYISGSSRMLMFISRCLLGCKNEARKGSKGK